MFWFPTPEIIEKREALKSAIERAREDDGLIEIEKIKHAFVSMGYTNEISLINLSGDCFELMAYLGLSNEEWDALKFVKWIS